MALLPPLPPGSEAEGCLDLLSIHFEQDYVLFSDCTITWCGPLAWTGGPPRLYRSFDRAEDVVAGTAVTVTGKVRWTKDVKSRFGYLMT